MMRPKSAKGRSKPANSPEQLGAKGTVPCDNCGGLQLVTWKGGGYNMASSSRMSNSTENSSENTRHLQDTYTNGLLQQIKLLELEISYLKQHPPQQLASKNAALERQTMRSEKKTDPPLDSSVDKEQQQQQMRSLRKDMMEKTSKLEAALAEKAQLSNRLKILEDRGQDGLSKQMETISKLTGKAEHFEAELRLAEDRFRATMSQLEAQTIMSKDREKQCQQLQEELESKEERLEAIALQMEAMRQQNTQKDRQIAELNEKFLQSSAHVMEEAINGLRDENKRLHMQIKELELNAEAERLHKARLEQAVTSLVGENAELASTLAEVKQKLESEIRARENRDAKLLLDTQEVVVAREREKELRIGLARLQTELERERNKAKSIGEKHAKDNQIVTALELKCNTQKSRIAELEGNLELLQENMAKVRQHSLLCQEKVSSMTRALEEKDTECHQLASKVATTENKLFEAERRVEALATLQSHRWMEFSKMADNMKELSHTMLTQSKSNTRKAAIRADLDEELEM